MISVRAATSLKQQASTPQGWSSHQYLPHNKYKTSGSFQNVKSLSYFYIFTYLTIPKFLYRTQFQIFYSLDHSRIWTFSTIQNFDTFDRTTILTFWTIPFQDHCILIWLTLPEFSDLLWLWDRPKICPRNVSDRTQICPRNVSDRTQAHPRHVQDFARNIPDMLKALIALLSIKSVLWQSLSGREE